MSQYASEEALRVYLPDEEDTPEITLALADVLTRATGILIRHTGQMVFGGGTTVRYLDVGFVTRLMLPRPGASTVSEVIEDGVTLETDQYELDPDRGLFLTRLEDDAVIRWLPGKRMVRVTYVAPPPPPDLQEACLELAAELWRGKANGFADTIGVSGSNELGYRGAFPPTVRSTLRNVRRDYGVDPR